MYQALHVGSGPGNANGKPTTMEVELGPDHERLINELYGLYETLNLSRDEQLILGMAIHMLEYLDAYKPAISAMDAHEYSDEELERNRQEVEAARRTPRIRYTVDDFERLICSGGFELWDGLFRPRF